MAKLSFVTDKARTAVHDAQARFAEIVSEGTTETPGQAIVRSLALLKDDVCKTSEAPDAALAALLWCYILDNEVDIEVEDGGE